VDTTGTVFAGWEKKATARPTAFMMVTTFAGVIGLKVGQQRWLAQPLSALQQHYRTALGLPVSWFTTPNSGYGTGDGGSPRVTASAAYPLLGGRGSPAEPGGDRE
jgi:hypothetical protein